MEKCLFEAGLKNLQLYQELQGILMSHLDLRKSEEMCKCITGAGERLAEDINFIHILILTFYCNKYLDKG